MADRLGQQFGNYRLVSLLGQGGYAEVYLGQHVRLDLQAAIKVLHTHLTGSEAEHFQQEAQTIARLAHPSIIRVFDFDVQDGTPFLVMDYAPNGSLRQRYPKGSLVPIPQIVSFVKQMSAALQYAHDKKFIHRDVKPENMLIGQHQEVLLSDFGIATIAHSTSSLNVGAEGTSGTLAYMAPEQIEGNPRAASDQYALGIVVYEWLCGERPFEGSASEVMAQHLSMSPPWLHERVPEIPPEIEQVVLRALSKDPKARFASVAAFSAALEQASQRALSPTAQLASEQPAAGSTVATSYDTVVSPDHPVLPKETTPSADLHVGDLEPTLYPDYPPPNGFDTLLSGTASDTLQRGQIVAPTAAVVHSPLEPTIPAQRKARRISRISAAMLIGLVVVVVAGGVLGSLSLLAHFSILGTHSGATISPVRGGTWTIGSVPQPDSLIPNGSNLAVAAAVAYDIDQALYLPLFYGDAQGVIHPGAASVVPTVQNGGINTNATTWTFHLRPSLFWSDGQPYDARDIDYTWKLWLNPKFGANFPNGATGFELIRSADVSVDHLSISFHLKQAYAAFLQYWVDGGQAPLPAHHFSAMAPGQILKSPDNLNPRVTSGPFLMAESVPGSRFTLVRNPRYYLASKGMPYLDKVVFRILAQNTLLTDLQANSIDSTTFLSLDEQQNYKRLRRYTLVAAPINVLFEMLSFNFHNTVLASHLEVRTAIAMAIDRQALIEALPQGVQSNPQCTDHSSFYHPGFEPSAPCPIFGTSAANQLLDNNGWVRGPDGVRSKGGQRLEFEFSSPIIPVTAYRPNLEAIVQRDLRAIGIKLDIQNYPEDIFFYQLLPGGKASPPTGALAGRYDIAEFANSFYWDSDDSSLLACDQIPPNGYNIDFYCNPALDALYKQELATTDQGTRQNIFEHIHLIYLTEFPLIFLFGCGPIYPVYKGAHNFQPSPLGFTDENIWEWWCDNGKC